MTQDSSQLPPRPASTQQDLFPIKSSRNDMLACIPENTKLSPELVKLSYDDFCKYLAKLGYGIKPKPEVFEAFHEIVSADEPYVDEEFSLIKGRPFMPAREAIVKWLNRPEIPQDLVTASVPFAILYQARGPVAAKNIFGALIPMTLQQKEQLPGTNLVLHPNLSVSPKGEVTSTQSGQVILKPGLLDFSDTYTVPEIRIENMQTLVFPCNVLVKCDLEGHMDWTVKGNLTVEGFWSAVKIKVKGNVHAQSGIQTNFSHDEENAIKIMGDLEANFIQSSSFIIGGNTKVDKAIINSLINVKSGNLECSGEPGKIVGSDIILNIGAIFAKNVGSEKDKPATITFGTEEGANKSKIEAVSEGTRVQIKKSHIIVKFTQPWPPQ